MQRQPKTSDKEERSCQGLVQSDKEDNVPDNDRHAQQQHEPSRKEKDSVRVELLGVRE